MDPFDIAKYTSYNDVVSKRSDQAGFLPRWGYPTAMSTLYPPGGVSRCSLQGICVCVHCHWHETTRPGNTVELRLSGYEARVVKNASESKSIE